HQEALTKHNPNHDEDRRRREAQQIERRVWRSQSQSPTVEIVEAEADKDDRSGSENDADQVDFHFRPTFIGSETETQQQHKRRNADQNAERRAPADEGAQN